MATENKFISKNTNKPEREYSRTGAENQAHTGNQRKEDRTTDKTEENRAELNGKKGKIETEHTKPTGKTSALPGNSGEDQREEGTASAGAGLGRNKGTGTRKKDNFQ